MWVYDGDTALIRVRGGEEKVRFIGLNCPELDEPWGKETLEYTRRILRRKVVYLERDVEERDGYGRLLAYVWIEPPTDRSEAEIKTKMLNAILLLNGYARKLDVFPNLRYAEIFSKLQMEAIRGQKGIWRPKSYENYYIGNMRSMKFHRPSCHYGRRTASWNRIIFKSRDEAIARGYTPCKACKP